MEADFHFALMHFFHNQKFEKSETVQSLWSGYGEIARYVITQSNHQPYNHTHHELPSQCIAKIVNLQHKGSHPKGWNGDVSHARKLSSYTNEQNFYQYFAKFTNEDCKVPDLFAAGQSDSSIWMLLEDLDCAGFDNRCTTKVSTEIVALGIKWLANFHACFMDATAVFDKTNTPPDISANFNPQNGSKTNSSKTNSSKTNSPRKNSPRKNSARVNKTVVQETWQHCKSKVWPIGTYWHLATRAQEFDAMPSSELKQNAAKIDNVLNCSRFKTLVHGDAKLANFCINSDNTKIAAVDFQYVGFGAGIKDIVYFLGSCLDANQLKATTTKLLDLYFSVLHQALLKRAKNVGAHIKPDTLNQLEVEYRYLYRFAWADFERFLRGWAPEHYKLNSYSSEQTLAALVTL